MKIWAASPSNICAKDRRSIWKASSRPANGPTNRARTNIRPRSCCRSEEHTSELQSLMRISYAVFCLKKKTQNNTRNHCHDHELNDTNKRTALARAKTVNEKNSTYND